MKDLEFSFELAPWEEAIRAIGDGGSICAAELLTMLEGESEDGVEEALMRLELRHITLDISRLPRPQASGSGSAAASGDPVGAK